MNKLKRLYPLVCLGLLLMLVQTLWAQRVSVKIYGSSSVGSDSLVVGNDPAATNHIDAGLGEEEQPVAPPTFDMRSVNLNNFGGLGRDTCLQGLKLNLHHQTRNTQTDAWKIQFQRDDSGTAVTFSWQDRLDTVGGGGWQLIDVAGGFPPVDMTTTTSVLYPPMNAQPQTYSIVIKHFDGLKMVTVDAESLALAHDAKGGIGKAQKFAPYHVDFTLTAKNTTSLDNTKLHIELPGALVGSLNIGTPGGTASNPDGKGKKWDITLNSAISHNPQGTVTVAGLYVGTKLGSVVYYWPNGLGKAIDGLKTKEIPPEILRYPKPNWVNLLVELFAQSHFPRTVAGKPWGLIVGSEPPADGKLGNTVYHPKYGDVLKTLYKSKLGTHLGGTGFGGLYCLNNFTKDGKPILKNQKTLPPDKHKNQLLAEAVTLKVNLEMNSNVNPKVEHPGVFGSLVYVGGTHANDATLNGLTVSQISTAIDSFLTCRHNGAMGAMSGAEALAVAHDLNDAFSAAFDTVQWAPKIIMKGVRAVADVPFLFRSSAVVPPVIIAPYTEVTEVPLKYSLDQNYPNPFNPTTTISFSLPEDGFVTLKVYNLLGQEVATLLNHEQLSEGSNEVEFDATTLSSGVYFYRLVANDGKFQEVKKMMLLK